MDEKTGDVMSVKLPVFDGSQKSFEIWHARFCAYAQVKRFKPALKIGGEVDLPTTEDAVIANSDEGKKQAAAKKRNEVAMANLTMSFTSNRAMGMVCKAQDDDWPGGRAHKVMESMITKYRPKDTISRLELRKKLNKVKMKKNEDPAVLFEI